MANVELDAMGDNCAHICVDVQRMFVEATVWQAPWMSRILPTIESIVDAHASRTIFTRFITPETPDAASGAWQRYYRRWPEMTRDRLPAEMLDLAPPLSRFVPPARVMDKTVYSPWLSSHLHRWLHVAGVDTLVVSGGETDVCVLATVMGAIDRGYRVILPTDALCGSADETHDAMLRIYESRFGMQLTVSNSQAVLDAWRA